MSNSSFRLIKESYVNFKAPLDVSSRIQKNDSLFQAVEKKSTDSQARLDLYNRTIELSSLAANITSKQKISLDNYTVKGSFSKKVFVESLSKKYKLKEYHINVIFSQVALKDKADIIRLFDLQPSDISVTRHQQKQFSEEALEKILCETTAIYQDILKIKCNEEIRTQYLEYLLFGEIEGKSNAMEFFYGEERPFFSQLLPELLSVAGVHRNNHMDSTFFGITRFFSNIFKKNDLRFAFTDTAYKVLSNFFFPDNESGLIQALEKVLLREDENEAPRKKAARHQYILKFESYLKNEKGSSFFGYDSKTIPDRSYVLRKKIESPEFSKKGFANLFDKPEAPKKKLFDDSVAQLQKVITDEALKLKRATKTLDDLTCEVLTAASFEKTIEEHVRELGTENSNALEISKLICSRNRMLRDYEPLVANVTLNYFRKKKCQTGLSDVVLEQEQSIRKCLDLLERFEKISPSESPDDILEQSKSHCIENLNKISILKEKIEGDFGENTEEIYANLKLYGEKIDEIYIKLDLFLKIKLEKLNPMQNFNDFFENQLLATNIKDSANNFKIIREYEKNMDQLKNLITNMEGKLKGNESLSCLFTQLSEIQVDTTTDFGKTLFEFIENLRSYVKQRFYLFKAEECISGYLKSSKDYHREYAALASRILAAQSTESQEKQGFTLLPLYESQLDDRTFEILGSLYALLTQDNAQFKTLVSSMGLASQYDECQNIIQKYFATPNLRDTYSDFVSGEGSLGAHEKKYLEHMILNCFSQNTGLLEQDMSFLSDFVARVGKNPSVAALFQSVAKDRAEQRAAVDGQTVQMERRKHLQSKMVKKFTIYENSIERLKSLSDVKQKLLNKLEFLDAGEIPAALRNDNILRFLDSAEHFQEDKKSFYDESVDINLLKIDHFTLKQHIQEIAKEDDNICEQIEELERRLDRVLDLKKSSLLEDLNLLDKEKVPSLSAVSVAMGNMKNVMSEMDGNSQIFLNLSQRGLDSLSESEIAEIENYYCSVIFYDLLLNCKEKGLYERINENHIVLNPKNKLHPRILQKVHDYNQWVEDIQQFSKTQDLVQKCWREYTKLEASMDDSKHKPASILSFCWDFFHKFMGHESSKESEPESSQRCKLQTQIDHLNEQLIYLAKYESMFEASFHENKSTVAENTNLLLRKSLEGNNSFRELLHFSSVVSADSHFSPEEIEEVVSDSETVDDDEAVAVLNFDAASVFPADQLHVVQNDFAPALAPLAAFEKPVHLKYVKKIEKDRMNSQKGFNEFVAQFNLLQKLLNLGDPAFLNQKFFLQFFNDCMTNFHQYLTLLCCHRQEDLRKLSQIKTSSTLEGLLSILKTRMSEFERLTAKNGQVPQILKMSGSQPPSLLEGYLDIATLLFVNGIHNPSEFEKKILLNFYNELVSEYNEQNPDSGFQRIRSIDSPDFSSRDLSGLLFACSSDGFLMKKMNAHTDFGSVLFLGEKLKLLNYFISGGMECKPPFALMQQDVQSAHSSEESANKAAQFLKQGLHQFIIEICGNEKITSTQLYQIFEKCFFNERFEFLSKWDLIFTFIPFHEFEKEDCRVNDIVKMTVLNILLFTVIKYKIDLDKFIPEFKAEMEQMCAHYSNRFNVSLAKKEEQMKLDRFDVNLWFDLNTLSSELMCFLKDQKGQYYDLFLDNLKSLFIAQNSYELLEMIYSMQVRRNEMMKFPLSKIQSLLTSLKEDQGETQSDEESSEERSQAARVVETVGAARELLNYRFLSTRGNVVQSSLRRAPALGSHVSVVSHFLR